MQCSKTNNIVIIKYVDHWDSTIHLAEDSLSEPPAVVLEIECLQLMLHVRCERTCGLLVCISEQLEQTWRY